MRAQGLKSDEGANALVRYSNEHAKTRAECAGQHVTAHFHMFIFEVIYFTKYGGCAFLRSHLGKYIALNGRKHENCLLCKWQIIAHIGCARCAS